MYQFSVLARISQPIMDLSEWMLTSVLAQSSPDWELVLVTSAENEADQAAAQQLATHDPRIRVEVRPEGELLAWSCDALMGTLGQWVTFLGQHDQLHPRALELMGQAITDHPQARVIYSDEDCLGTWGQVSLPFAKGAPDLIRLQSEQYLRDLAVIEKDWLAAVDGFDRLASDEPFHDLYLRLAETLGSSGFAHVPRILYHRHRNRLLEGGDDPRHSPYLPGYDLGAVRRYYERMGTPAHVEQWNGTLCTDFKFTHAPSVTVLLVVGDDIGEGKARLQAMKIWPVYQPCDVKVMFHGQSAQAWSQYQKLCDGLRYPIKRITGNLPEALNQEVSVADTDLTLFLQGQALNAYWLKRLVSWIQWPDVMAVNPNLITPTRKIGGLPWDSRGRFNHLAVPHSASALSPLCLLVDTRKFLELGGFDADYPTLYGMDFSLRLSQQGHTCVCTPRAQVQVSPGSGPDANEVAAFRAAWGGWEDPFGLAQLP